MQEPVAGLAPHNMCVHLCLHPREIGIYLSLEFLQTLT